MKKYSPEEENEIHNLMTRLGNDERENYLVALEKAFRGWKRGTISFVELDGMLMNYGHIKVNQDHGDPVISIADALAEGKLERSSISDTLYERIEIVVRLMKN
jgi:hypothetical protein